MKISHFLICIIIAGMLFCGCAAAANVTTCIVDNCNLYAGSNEFPIAPTAELDAGSTATNIASENELIRIAEISVASVGTSQEKQITAVVQGSTASLDADDAYVDYVGGYEVVFGDGEKTNTNPLSIYLIHTYPYATGYTIVMTVSNCIADAVSSSYTFSQTYNGYQTYSDNFIPIIALFALIPLIFVVIMIYMFITGAVDTSLLMPTVIMVIIAVVLLAIFVMVGGIVDNATANFFR